MNMKVHSKFRFLFILLILTCCASAAFGQSKYEKIKDGVGNILIGEVLPYNNDAGYKNVVLDSVKLSQMKTWETFYFRAFLGKKMNDIEHDIKILAFHFEGVGKKAAQFAREAGGNYLIVRSNDKSDFSYGERTEWSVLWQNFRTDPEALVMVGFRRDYDYTKPETFTYRTLSDDLGDDLPFNAKTLQKWKDTYGLSSIVVSMNAFSFIDGGKKTEGENKKVLKRNSNGSWEEKEELGKTRTYTIWEGKQHLATGGFRIVLD